MTDNNTGLMWQKCSAGQNNDSSCSGSAATYNWWKATGTPDANFNPSGGTNICGALNTSNFGGHNDWRLPTEQELQTIVDYSIPYPGPTIKAAYFPNTIAGPLDAYWSYNTYTHAGNYAWRVFFNDSHVGYNYKTALHNVRCVRGEATAQSFTPNGNTVTDNRTGLVWQKCSAGQNDTTCLGSTLNYTLPDALTYCNNLELPSPGGYTDWRLPNVKELNSLTDTSRYGPAIDPGFPSTIGSAYWSSTTFAYDSYSTFYVGFADGLVSFYHKTDSYNYNVRCVRGGQNGPPNYLVRLMDPGNPVNTYSTLHDAYAAAYEGYMIQAEATDLTETLTLADNKAVTLRGGYDSDFLLDLSMTTLNGSLTITGGTLTVENLIIE